VLLQLDHEAL